MAWWLIPITATLLAIVWVTWRARPRRPADPHDTLAAHRRFTDALTRTSAHEVADSEGHPEPSTEHRRSA